MIANASAKPVSGIANSSTCTPSANLLAANLLITKLSYDCKPIVATRFPSSGGAALGRQLVFRPKMC